MRKSLTQRTLEGAAWIGGASVARLALRVVSVAILARLLTPHEYGVVAGALIAMDFASMIYGMGLAPTLVQRRVVRPDHVATAFFCALFVALLAAAGMWVAAPLIADLLQIPELTQILKVLAWLTPFGAFGVLSEALLARNMRVKSVAIRPLFSFTIANFLVAIPLAWYGFGYWSLIAMQGVDIVVSAAMLGFAARKLLVWPRFSRRAFSELWRLSLGFTVNQPFIYLSQNSDRFIIGRVLGTATLGIYTRASFFTNTATTLFGSITRLSVFPAMAKVQQDEARLRSALLKSFSLLALLTLPVSAFCVIFAPELVDLLLGPKWHSAVAPFAILSGTLYLSLAWRNCATLFQALGHPYWMTTAHICRAAALIVGIWWIAPYGLTAICTVIGVVIGLTLAIMLVIVKYAIDLPLRSVAAAHVRPLMMTAATSGLCLTAKALLPELPGPALVMLTLALLLSSTCIFVFFNQERVLGFDGALALHRPRKGEG
jgi:O-antigen/teichoic acid export membrane protein